MDGSRYVGMMRGREVLTSSYIGVAKACAYCGSRFRGSYAGASATASDLGVLSSCLSAGVVLNNCGVR